MNKNRMRQQLYIICILCIFPFISNAQNPSSFFPEVKEWNLDVGDQVYNPDNLWDLINGAADAYLSYDFRNLYTAEYSDTDDKSVKVYIFKHGDDKNAFGIYSQERNRDYDFLNIGSQAFSSSGALYFIKGPYYVQLSTNEKSLYDKLGTLAKKIAKNIDAQAEMPEEIGLFPGEGKIKHSEKFIAEDYLGYSYMHSAFVADYENEDEEEFQIFIISPDDRQEIKNMLDKFLDAQDQPKENRDKKTFKVDAKYIGNILFYNSGDYLFGIKGAN
ncbi:MAG: DUF6599 family protein, partial [Bacteroidales bacterium]